MLEHNLEAGQDIGQWLDALGRNIPAILGAVPVCTGLAHVVGGTV
jgi:hypothetical protein